MDEARGQSASKKARRFSLRFETREAFEDQYTQNLAKGGAFIETETTLELREVVQVDLDFAFTGRVLPLAAEVVHCLSAENAPPGISPGVAVQFLEEVRSLRDRIENAADGVDDSPARVSADPPTRELDEAPELAPAALPEDARERASGAIAEDAPQEPMGDPADIDPSLFDHDAFDLSGGGEGLESLVGMMGDPEAVGDPVFSSCPPENDRTFTERAERESVRVPVEVRSSTGIALRGRTRNVSETGVLVSIDGEELAEGREVTVVLIHPRTGVRLPVPGRVARRIEGNGVVCAAAIQLAPAGEDREELGDFVTEVHEIERTYRQRGIRGHLQELGALSLVRMFAALAPRGTLTVSSGVEEGTIAFEGSQLALAEVGSVEGVKALARVLTWREGRFEFRAQIDAVTAEEPRTSLERAIETALAVIEEGGELQGPALSPDQRFLVNHAKLEDLDTALNKSEEAVLELAAANFTLRRIMDVIPDNDAQVRSAIFSLTQRGLLTPVPSVGAN